MAGKEVNVHVEYCGAWGYEPRFKKLQGLILAAVPGAKVDGKKGRATSFEVTVNEKLIFSKLSKGAFPVFEEVVKSIDGVAHGGEPAEVVAMQEGNSCILM